MIWIRKSAIKTSPSGLGIAGGQIRYKYVFVYVGNGFKLRVSTSSLAATG